METQRGRGQINLEGNGDREIEYMETQRGIETERRTQERHGDAERKMERRRKRQGRGSREEPGVTLCPVPGSPQPRGAELKRVSRTSAGAERAKRRPHRAEPRQH